MGHESAKRKRLFVAWMITAPICVGAVSVDLLLDPPRIRLAGLDVAGTLTVVTYLAVATLSVISIRWMRARRARGGRRITVRELRELAGRR